MVDSSIPHRLMRCLARLPAAQLMSFLCDSPEIPRPSENCCELCVQLSVLSCRTDLRWPLITLILSFLHTTPRTWSQSPPPPTEWPACQVTWSGVRGQLMAGCCGPPLCPTRTTLQAGRHGQHRPRGAALTDGKNGAPSSRCAIPGALGRNLCRGGRGTMARAERRGRSRQLSR